MDDHGTEARTIATLLEVFPAFEPVVRDLGADAGGELSLFGVFSELAALATSLLAEDDEHSALLETLFSAVETVASSSRAIAVEAVGLSFLAALDPGTLAACSSYLGPATEGLLEALALDTLLLEEAPPA